MRNLTKFSFLLLLLPLLTACPVKNRPRVEHEGRREWTPQETPLDNSVDVKSFNDFDISSAYAFLKDGQGDLVNRVLKPLSQFVLNGKFIERAEFRTQRLTQMIEVFNTALLDRLMAKDNSPDVREIKAKFTQTVFAGCSRDLKSDCYNAEIFSRDTRHTRLMTLLAMEFDAQIEEAVKANKTTLLCVTNDAGCRNMVETRYRLLAMALYKRNRYDDPDFSFAYLKHSRIFAELVQVMRAMPSGQLGNMATSYLAESHTRIFESIIPKFKPRNENDPEFRQFVENFNPWGFSRKKADIFQYGTGIMFSFAAKCCMYKDSAKTQISDSMENTIRAEQVNPNSLSPSLYTMIKAIQAEHGDKLFANMRMSATVNQALIVDRPNPQFYNEYFFVVDRLFRGDLSSEEVEMVLRRANQQRLKTVLPQLIQDYIKINLLYMIVETNKFMRKEIYTSGVSSDKIFEKAVTTSRSLTSRWHDMQAQVGQLERLMGSYFKTNFITSKEYVDADKLIKSLNRNIHYLSVYPQMMVLNYYLATMDGKLIFDTWWGRIEIDASTIIGSFFDGTTVNPWFRFGSDPETLNRQMLLFSFEYMLTTETMKYFVTNGSNDRARFFDMIVGKYFDIELHHLNTYISQYERDIYSQENSSAVDGACDYESGKSNQPPAVDLDFLGLNQFTYTGLADMGLRRSLMKILTGTSSSTGMLRGTIENRSVFLKVMLDIINADLKRNNVFSEDHADTKRIRDGLKSMDGLKARLAKLFLANHKRYFDCALKLDQIERARANRLYEEERAYLKEIYKLISPLKDITDASKLQAEAAKMTEELRKRGARFDSVDGRTYSYKYFKYDLFKRVQKNIEDDIFANKPTGNPDLDKHVRPRPVRVHVGANVERNEITDGSKFVSLVLRGSEQDFINQGMTMFNGKTGAFIDWSEQMQRDPQLMAAIAPMIEFYLLGPIKDGRQTLEITKEDLTKAYLTVLAEASMNKIEQDNSIQFQNDGVMPKSFFQGKLFEADFRRRLPLFYDLVRKVAGSAELFFDGKYRLSKTLEFASIYNTLQTFVFDPETILVAQEDGKPPVPKYRVGESVKVHYGERMHDLFNRTIELLRFIDKEEKRANKNPGALDPRFLEPFYLENRQPVKWYEPSSMPSDFQWIADKQKRDDIKDVRADFISRSGDFFRSSKLILEVQAPEERTP